jgi:stress response protein YsnF
MSRTVTALYDTRQEAEAARQRLGSAVELERVSIIDKQAGGEGRSLSDLHMSQDDRHTYGEGLRRGGFLLCAEVESGEDADRIVGLLDQSSSVDLDERQRNWQSEGWSPQGADASGQMGQSERIQGQSSEERLSEGQSSQANVVEEERIPVVQEELRVGKREIERGGARVRSYVREVPVQEEVTLREERVEVERRPVNQEIGQQSASGSEDLLQDREVEMRETAEEAVVQKVANVTEEVVMRKTAEERTEQISDSVRHTEVDVQQGAEGRSAFGGFGASGEGSQSQSGDQSAEFDRDPSR